MRTRIFAISLAVVVVAGSIVALRARAGSAPPAPPAAAPAPVAPISVTVTPAQRGNWATSIIATGTVASLREAKVASTLSGIVGEVFVSEGQRVKQGEPLMRLRTDQLAAVAAQAAASVAQAKAGRDLAEANLQRTRSLFQPGAVSVGELDTAEAQFRQTQAQLQLAEASSALAQIQLRDATVTAPFGGTITQRKVEPGEAVSPMSLVFVLAQLDDVNAELVVPERDREGLRVGQSAIITVDALPGMSLAGKIAEIQPAATISSRSFTVKVRVANAQRVLRPGMFTRGTITVAVRPNVLQIPASAVLTTAGKPIVFIVQEGKAIRREVTLGDRQNGMVEITSGLNANDQVITSDAAGLTENQPVTPQVSQ
jgi:membrane fusion protein (multidrug efflux system)